MIRLVEIAQSLGELYQSRALLALREWQLKESILGRQVYLTPAEGWPGKNSEQREVEAQKTFAGDEPLQEMAEILTEIREEMADLDGSMQALEAERRALEWGIRADLVSALSGKRNGHGDISEHAFDDAGQGAIDDQTVEMATRLTEKGWKNGAQAEYDHYRQEEPENIGPKDVIGGTVIYQSRPEIDEDELPF